MKLLKGFQVIDDLTTQDQAAIEVRLELHDGSQRWCCFAIPAALGIFGDWIAGTSIPFHFASPHLIVVGHQLSQELIGQALRDIDERGELMRCSRALE